MPLRAAFFDVGDTLVEHWAPRDVVNRHAREQVRAALGEHPWLDDLLDARLEPDGTPLVEAVAAHGGSGSRYRADERRQDTVGWIRAWFERRGIELDGLDLDQLRRLMCVPLEGISTPVRGAFDAVRWCAEHGLKVVLVTNTLARGDEEALDDWRRFGLDDALAGVVSSHSVGWRKPHPAMFERALEIAGARPEEAFHVGDNLVADVWGAQQAGLRGVWRVSARARPPTDERGAPPADPLSGGACRHPSEALFIEEEVTRCRSCAARVPIAIRPDAIVADMTDIPALVERWAA